PPSPPAPRSPTSHRPHGPDETLAVTSGTAPSHRAPRSPCSLFPPTPPPRHRLVPPESCRLSLAPLPPHAPHATARPLAIRSRPSSSHGYFAPASISLRRWVRLCRTSATTPGTMCCDSP